MTTARHCVISHEDQIPGRWQVVRTIHELPLRKNTARGSAIGISSDPTLIAIGTYIARRPFIARTRLIGKMQRTGGYAMARLAWLAALMVLCGSVAAQEPAIDLFLTDPMGPQEVGQEKPLGDRQNRDVSLFAAPGEFEPFSFALQPKERLLDVMITASDLTGQGGIIPKSKVRIQSIEGGFGDNKTLLDLGRSWDMPAWSRELFWVTVHVPDNAGPGFYRGQILVHSGEKVVATLGLTLEVLPFRLEEPPFMIGWHYAWPGSVEALRATLLDMREHGATNVGPLYGFHLPINDDDTQQIALFIDEYRKAGFSKPIMFAAPMNLVVSELKGYGPIDSKRFQQKYLQVMRKLHAVFEAKQMPAIFSVGDEFTNLGLPGVEYAGKLARLCFEELPEICVTSDMNGYQEVMAMAPFLNYATFNNGWDGIDNHNRGRRLVNEAFLREVTSTGAIPYFVNTGRGRFPFGFFFWRMSRYGVAGKVEWFYNLEGKGGNAGSMVRLEGTRIIPTLDYERSREGIDDLRYVCHLEKLITQARKTNEAASQADRAADFLKAIGESIIPDWTAYSQGGMRWPSDGMELLDPAKVASLGSLNSIRRQIADHIISLQQALSQTNNQSQQ